MSHKKFFTPSTVIATLIIASILVLIQFGGASIRDLIDRVFIFAICALLVLSYVLRIALVFLGVFAVYRAIKHQVNRQDFEQMEMQLGLK